MISDEEKELVREKTDVLQIVGETVNLKRSGSSYSGCCPFHADKSPSFHINPNTGLWKCFGCQKSGDIFSFVMEREHIEFPDAIRYLAERAHIELHEDAQRTPNAPKKTRLFELLDATEKYYSQSLLRGVGPACDDARRYFSSRGFNIEVCKRWGLGFAPGHGRLANHLMGLGFTQKECEAANVLVGRGKDRFFNRVMFPIHDESGRCIGFGGRVLNDAKPKYLNTSDTMVFHKKKNMYAYDKARESIVAEGYAIVVEGYTDVIAMHEAGITNVVAVLGTALTLDHIKLLSRFAKKIIFMFDGDAAGQHAAKRSLQFMKDTEADMRCVILPDNLDPADFIAQRGVESLKEHLSKSEPLIDFVFEIILSEYDLSIAGQRVKAFDELCSLLSVFKNSILLDEYARRLSDAFHIEVKDAKRGIVEAKPFITAESHTTSNISQAKTQYKNEVYTQGYSQSKVEVQPIVDPELDRYEGYEYIDEYPSYEDVNYYESIEQVQPKVEVLLSREDKDQLQCEKELLTFFATYPRIVKSFKTSLENIDWVEPSHKTICEAMLATDDNADVNEVVRAAREAVPQADKILTSGNIIYEDTHEKDEKIKFILVNLELQMTKRRIREKKAEGNHTSDNAQMQQVLDDLKVLSEHRDRLMEILTKI